jgi:hypothetical protein
MGQAAVCARRFDEAEGIAEEMRELLGDADCHAGRWCRATAFRD